MLPSSVFATVFVLSSVDDLTLVGDKMGTRKLPKNCFRSKADNRNQIARITIRLATFLEFCCCLAILVGNAGVASQKKHNPGNAEMSLKVL